MGVELITGFAGKAHIRSLDMARFNAGVVGKGDYVFAGIGDGELKATMTTPNRVHIASGNGMMQGRHYTVDAAGVDLTVQTGTQGQKRNDLVVARYAKNASTGIETVSLAVLKGTPTAGAPADPAHVKGDILNGAAIATDMPLWRIPLNGITVGAPVKLFKEFTPCSDAWDSVSRAAKFVAGTTVVYGIGQNYVYPFTIQSVLPPRARFLTMSVMNGDWPASPHVVTGVSNQGGTAVVHLGDVLGSGYPIRINYRIDYE